MNKLTFIIQDCFNQAKRYHLRAVAGGYARPDLTQEQFINDCCDSVCERAAAGVRYQGKDKIRALLWEYAATQKNFFETLKK